MSRYLQHIQNEGMQASVRAMMAEVDPYDINEELAIVRLTLEFLVKQYDRIVTKYEAGEAQEDHVIIAGAMARKVAGDVAIFAQRAQAIQRDQAEMQLTGMQMLAIVKEQLDQHFGDDPRAELLQRALPELLQAQQQVGTTITPDMDVAAMDATIPLVTQSEAG